MPSSWRVYIKPFDDNGNYADWVDVTGDTDLNAVSTISSDLDNTEYDIGVYRYSSFKLTLGNDHGRYSDVGSPKSIFRYKRSNSLVKVTWHPNEIEAIAGFTVAGAHLLGPVITMFTGLLSDESLAMDLDSQKLSFTVLGRESIFQKVIVPFADISDGQSIKSVIITLLDQPAITALLTVDSANINVGVDQNIDLKSSLENKTVQEALNNLLFASNSVLFIDGDAIKVAPRTATPAVQYTFYGQASEGGIENVQNIKAIKNGLAKTFNYISWKGVPLSDSDFTSVAKWGARKKEVDFEFYSNSTKRSNVLAAIKTEFAYPKQEFDLYTPLRYDNAEIGLLDRVSVDYPTVYYSTGSDIPICGIATCGDAVLPRAKWLFTLDPDAHYKVIGRSIDPKNSLLKLKLREI